MIVHSRPTLSAADTRRLADVVRSARIAQGARVLEFEQALARRIGVRYAAAVNSGTAALHLALLALGVGEKHEVIIPSYVCTALLNAVKYVGARPVPAEIDPRTYNLDPLDVKRRLSTRTGAVIAPHMFGLPADIKELMSLGVPVVEDCAQAIGATRGETPVGKLGQAAIFSFYATKVMTTGEGGMVVSDSKAVIERVRDLREYDKRRDYKVRYNYKMTDMQAAVGLPQLARLDNFVRRRNRIAGKYDRAFQGLPVGLPVKHPGRIYFRYVMDVAAPLKWIQLLGEKGIGCARPVGRPIHRYLAKKNYPRTESAWRRSLSIPIYPSLSDRDADRVVAALVETSKEICGGQPNKI